MNNEQIFEELKAQLLEQSRLLKRFYEFCLAYQDFEFDELGLNTDEAENEKRKALKIKDKLLSEISKNFDYILIDNETNVLKNKIELIVEFNINESKKIVKFDLDISEDSFILETK